jgi:predicted nucleic acid-binding protein
LADADVFEPRWSQKVIDEMQKNVSKNLPEVNIDKRVKAMKTYFADAMVSAPPQELQDQMQADPKDKHVLAAAVASESDVLVTNNLKDFDPPSTGPHAMRVESLNQFLSRKLAEDPERVQAALQEMVSNYRRDPRTMSGLIDTMVETQELHDFAQELNRAVPPAQRGTSEALNTSQAGSAKSAALDGVPSPTAAVQSTPDLSKTTKAANHQPQRGQDSNTPRTEL